jgi:hypothetical protein
MRPRKASARSPSHHFVPISTILWPSAHFTAQTLALRKHLKRRFIVMTAKSLSRRKFLALAGLTGTGLGLAACAQKPAATPTAMAGMEGGSPTPSGAGYEEMDKMHKAGVDTFVANAGKDPTFWRQPLTPKVDGDVKVFEITCIPSPSSPRPARASACGI